jgi:membrane-anchored mycosin MYCP
MIDPLAALTAQLPDQPVSVGADKPRAIPAPYLPPPPDPRPRRYAAIGSIACLATLGIGAVLAIPFRRRRAASAPDSEL